MTNTNYEEFFEEAGRGEILIGIDPAVARRFFTDTDHMAIQQKIGEPLFKERFFVKTVWLSSIISLFAGAIVSILALGWHSAIRIEIRVYRDIT